MDKAFNEKSNFPALRTINDLRKLGTFCANPLFAKLVAKAAFQLAGQTNGRANASFAPDQSYG